MRFVVEPLETFIKKQTETMPAVSVEKIIQDTIAPSGAFSAFFDILKSKPLFKFKKIFENFKFYLKVLNIFKKFQNFSKIPNYPENSTIIKFLSILLINFTCKTYKGNVL